MGHRTGDLVRVTCPEVITKIKEDLKNHSYDGVDYGSRIKPSTLFVLHEYQNRVGDDEIWQLQLRDFPSFYGPYRVSVHASQFKNQSLLSRDYYSPKSDNRVNDIVRITNEDTLTAIRESCTKSTSSLVRDTAEKLTPDSRWELLQLSPSSPDKSPLWQAHWINNYSSIAYFVHYLRESDFENLTAQRRNREKYKEYFCVFKTQYLSNYNRHASDELLEKAYETFMDWCHVQNSGEGPTLKLLEMYTELYMNSKAEFGHAYELRITAQRNRDKIIQIGWDHCCNKQVKYPTVKEVHEYVRLHPYLEEAISEYKAQQDLELAVKSALGVPDEFMSTSKVATAWGQMSDAEYELRASELRMRLKMQDGSKVIADANALNNEVIDWEHALTTKELAQKQISHLLKSTTEFSQTADKGLMAAINEAADAFKHATDVKYAELGKALAQPILDTMSKPSPVAAAMTGVADPLIKLNIGCDKQGRPYKHCITFLLRFPDGTELESPMPKGNWRKFGSKIEHEWPGAFVVSAFDSKADNYSSIKVHSVEFRSDYELKIEDDFVRCWFNDYAMRMVNEQAQIIWEQDWVLEDEEPKAPERYQSVYEWL